MGSAPFFWLLMPYEIVARCVAFYAGSALGRRRSPKNVIKEVSMKQPTNTDRRDFLKATAAVTAFPGIISAQTVTNAIKVGLVGCGGRGTGAASQALAADDYSELTAMADIDPGNIEKSMAALQRIPKTGGRVKVDEAKRFIGLDAYQKVLDSGIDVVLLTTPPGFRSMRLAASIAANKHISTRLLRCLNQLFSTS